MWILNCCLLILFSILIGGAIWWDLREDQKTDGRQAEKVKPLTIETAEPVIEPDLTEIYSESGIVVRLEDGKVMTQFGQDERIFPASLTKIMTCIIALEQIEDLEEIRLRFVQDKKKEDWYDMIQLLPTSYNQMRTCTLNYETLVNIYYARRNHKLEEWHAFCRWIETLPYARELILGEEETEA